MDAKHGENLFFIRINRLINGYKISAPSIIIKNELVLIDEACNKLIKYLN